MKKRIRYSDEPICRMRHERPHAGFSGYLDLAMIAR
jgi:hypothetical protein